MQAANDVPAGDGDIVLHEAGCDTGVTIASLVPCLPHASARVAEDPRLEDENTQLSERLETRKIVERAKGILQRDLGVTEEEAYLTIQRQSRQRRKSKKEIAEAIVLGDDLRRGKQP